MTRMDIRMSSLPILFGEDGWGLAHCIWLDTETEQTKAHLLGSEPELPRAAQKKKVEMDDTTARIKRHRPKGPVPQGTSNLQDEELFMVDVGCVVMRFVDPQDASKQRQRSGKVQFLLSMHIVVSIGRALAAEATGITG